MISKFLGRNFKVKASVGHIKNLPKGKPAGWSFELPDRY